MAYTIVKHLNYNAWANEQLCELINPLDEPILYKEVKNSFNCPGQITTRDVRSFDLTQAKAQKNSRKSITVT